VFIKTIFVANEIFSIVVTVLDIILQNCEIENSIIMDDCKIKSKTSIHDSIVSHGSVIEDSTIPKKHQFLLGERSQISL